MVLAGTDGTGTYYAVQTLRQLITHRSVHAVVVRDWPSIPVRGVIEGFYGPSWPDTEIASQLRFYGANKLNTFVYSAKDDPYLRADWAGPLPRGAAQRADPAGDDRAAAQVNFVYALSPGLSICYSDPASLQELEAKDQQLWAAGVRQFALFFDDIGTGFNCAADSTQFGSSPDPLAAAQAYLLNQFVTGFIDTHPGAQELITVPTDYAGDADSAYRQVWKASLNPDVLVYWTGVGVIPQTITAAQAQATAAEFGHQIVVWDNYPVNDYQPTRLFLGPTGRPGRQPGHPGGRVHLEPDAGARRVHHPGVHHRRLHLEPGRLRPGAGRGVGRGHRRLWRPGRGRAAGVRGQQPVHATDRHAARIARAGRGHHRVLGRVPR